jgi:hypothetical protein
MLVAIPSLRLTSTCYCIITVGKRINFPFVALETSFEHCNRNKVYFQMCRSEFLKYSLVNVRIFMDKMKLSMIYLCMEL